MIIRSVVSEELRWQDFGTDGRTDGRSDCTPRTAFAFGDAGKKKESDISLNLITIQQDAAEAEAELDALMEEMSIRSNQSPREEKLRRRCNFLNSQGTGDTGFSPIPSPVVVPNGENSMPHWEEGDLHTPAENITAAVLQEMWTHPPTTRVVHTIRTITIIRLVSAQFLVKK